MRPVLPACALLLLAGAASAQVPGFSAAPQAAAPAAGWTQFREPSEGAYTVDVPQGWRAEGGVRRFAASEAPTWFTAESPDGSAQLFIGDPALGIFYLPAQFMPEGSQMPGLHGRAATVTRYRPGAEYATLYGTRSLSSICSGLQAQGTRPMPKMEDEMRGTVQTATRLDAGEATFACQRNGQSYTAAVDAGTGLVMFPGGNGAGMWAVVALRGYLAPTASAGQVAQILEHVTASFKFDPQFEAAIKQAGAQEEEQARIAAQQRAAAPPPAPAVTPYRPIARPSSGAGACPDDLQQQRICYLGDGRLVVSGGCLRCISQ